MLFNSVSFALFLSVCAAGYYFTPYWFRNVFLLAASYYFYMCWMPQYAILIGFSTFVTWGAGFFIDKSKSANNRKIALCLNLIINIAILFIFKYYNFFTDILELLLNKNDFLPRTNLLLPVGISFYTFQALGYTIDVYRGENYPGGGIRHERNFINYAVFVSFFPQLVAGPIERSHNLLPQFREEHTFSITGATRGLRLILIGLFKKIVIADMLAMFVDNVFREYQSYTGLTLICAIFFFTVQIYCDFSGYSDVARGTAEIFGFRLMENFKAPYMSTSIKEFWNRWHISLSTWLKDYIYIPLGGGNVAFSRKLLNIMIVFLISGLWHGAQFTFVLWGLLHGIYRITEEALKKYSGKGQNGKVMETKIMTILRTFFTLILVMLAWTFFRADSISQSLWILGHYLKGIHWMAFLKDFSGVVESFMPSDQGFVKLYTILTVPSIGLLFYSDWLYKYRAVPAEKKLEALPAALRWGIYYGLILSIMFAFVMTTNEFGQAGAFLYFQF